MSSNFVAFELNLGVSIIKKIMFCTAMEEGVPMFRNVT
jgi:hypothetical protein